MTQPHLVLYVYRCAECGHRGEQRLADDSHDGETSTCSACGSAVSLEWDGGVLLESACVGGTVTVFRVNAGVAIEGTHLRIDLLPISWVEPDNATVSIYVAAKSERFGDSWANMTYEQQNYFTAAGVELVTTESGADELRCLRRDHGVPAFRTGFTLTLEPGMRAFLETEIPRIEFISQSAARVRAVVEPHLQRQLEPYADSTIHSYESEIINRIVAKVVLDGESADNAIRYAKLLHDDTWAFSDNGDNPQYAELGVALRQADVIATIGVTPQF